MTTLMGMNNKTKLFIVLAVTGWIRVLFILTPIALVYFGVNKQEQKDFVDVSTPTEQMEQRHRFDPHRPTNTGTEMGQYQQTN